MPGNDVENREDDINERIDNFAQNLKQRNVVGSYNVAVQTVNLLVRVISQKKWLNAGELMELIRTDGKKMIAADPTDTTIGNMVRRVLKIVREEYASFSKKGNSDESEDSLHKLLLPEGTIKDYSRPCFDLKAVVIEAINELKSEIETSTENIASQSLEYIHSNEVIMTAGYSTTLLAFLKNAAMKRRTFQVIVAECAPLFLGQKLAKELAEANVETTVINDSAVFAIMSRVNKVIIGTHTVIANGGLKAISGSHAIALAAKHYSVPLLVCASMYKLSPQFLVSYDQDSFNKFLSPNNVMDYSEGELLSKIQIHNPVFDYVPPELVTLYVSNIGGNAPSYVYRLLSEMYHPDDHDL